VYDHDKMNPQKKMLTEDFVKLSKGLTDKYHPSQLNNLANIGAVLTAMHHVGNEYGETPHATHRNDLHPSPNPHHGNVFAEKDNIMPAAEKDDIAEELHDSEKYYNLWKQTHDENYRIMARDELRHADILLKKNHNLDTMKAQEYANKYNQLLKKLG